MNPSRVYDRVCREWSQLDFELTKSNSEMVRFKANIVAEDYFDDGVFTEVTVYDDGTVHIFLTFDELDRVLSNYEMVNEFNCHTAFAKASIKTINGNNFLQIHYALSSIDEKDAADNVNFALNDLLSDDVLKYLKPLTRVTR